MSSYKVKVEEYSDNRKLTDSTNKYTTMMVLSSLLELILRSGLLKVFIRGPGPLRGTSSLNRGVPDGHGNGVMPPSHPPD